MFGPSRSPVRRCPRLFLEELESRTLMSASALDALAATPQAVLNYASGESTSIDLQRHGGGGGGGGGGSIPPPPSGVYTPSQIQTAYGFNKITFNNGAIKGDGSGQTIAIVDAFNDPKIQSNLAAFDSAFHLPTANLTVVEQRVGRKLPVTNSGWSLEISLDVEWAHAMAPGANILLVEANTNSYSNLLAAVDYAKTASVNGVPVSVVSMSWGGGEFSGETSNDYHFNQSGVTFVASSGDLGAPPSWPAVSPNIVAVGGTTLTADSSGNYVSETGWSDSGGGISAYESKPTYQNSVTQSSTQRTNPDVAYNADPGTITNPTGFAVYDTVSYNGHSGWFDVGGTSAGAPQWSALVAIANQGRVLAGKSALSGASQTLPALYNMSPNDFNDITSGNNGYSAGAGYDLVTGLGTPHANLVVAALVNATNTGNVGGMIATNDLSSSSPSVKRADVLGGNSTSSFSGTGAVSLISQTLAATAATDPTILTQAAQTSNTTLVSSFNPLGMSSAFGTGQASATRGGITSSQTSSSLAAALGFQFYASAPKSISDPAANLGNYLRPFPSASSDGVPLTGPDDADEPWGDGPLDRRRTPPPLLQREIDLHLAPAFLAEEASACDACFADEAGMAFLVEEQLNGNEGESLRLHGPAVALLGILASRFWMAPEAAEERRNRRAILVV